VVGAEDVGAEVDEPAEVCADDPEDPDDPDESQAASTPVARRAAAASTAPVLRHRRPELGPDLARTAETLVAAGRDECAGPGAPHGAWPLVAA
jgi:hypothetical protein